MKVKTVRQSQKQAEIRDRHLLHTLSGKCPRKPVPKRCSSLCLVFKFAFSAFSGFSAYFRCFGFSAFLLENVCEGGCFLALLAFMLFQLFPPLHQFISPAGNVAPAIPPDSFPRPTVPSLSGVKPLQALVMLPSLQFSFFGSQRQTFLEDYRATVVLHLDY